jgi:hypothetical protein
MCISSPNIILVILFSILTLKKKIMIQFGQNPKKPFMINEDDHTAMRFAMLIEGSYFGVHDAINKYGYTEPGYYQILNRYQMQGSKGLIDKKRGPVKPYVRTNEVENQIIRMRFLDPSSGAEIISQKLKQLGHRVSVRSVERTITKYGLKKNSLLQPSDRKRKRRS